MNRQSDITCAFVDIGGVLLSNGWDRHARERAAFYFSLDLADFNERHKLNVEVYELGKLSLDDYLSRVVFYKNRLFSREKFKAFIFEQSTAIPEMLELIAQIKHKHGLKLVAFSNEGREINEHRIQHFKLDKLFDFFVSSCYVNLRKPDLDMFKLALDQVQIPASKILMIDNTILFTDIAKSLGMQTIQHEDYAKTCAQLRSLGLVLNYSHPLEKKAIGSHHE